MRVRVNILEAGLIFAVFACNSSSNKQVVADDSLQGAGDNQSLVADSAAIEPLTVKANKSKDLRADCVRGQALPVLRKSVYPNTKFQLQADSLSAIETVRFKNGDTLSIKNWGCEYYTLTFRFATSRFQGEVSNTRFWYQKSALLISELYEGLDAPINIRKGVGRLNNYVEKNGYNKYEPLELGKEIDFGDGEIRNFVTVEKIEKLANKRFAVTISFSIGPL